MVRGLNCDPEATFESTYRPICESIRVSTVLSYPKDPTRPIPRCSFSRANTPLNEHFGTPATQPFGMSASSPTTLHYELLRLGCPSFSPLLCGSETAVSVSPVSCGRPLYHRFQGLDLPLHLLQFGLFLVIGLLEALHSLHEQRRDAVVFHARSILGVPFPRH